MSKKDKNKKGNTRVYTLKVVYNTKEDRCELVEEKIEGDSKFVTHIPNIDLSDFFDDDIIELINESYEIGEA